jgi:hypothetical protein
VGSRCRQRALSPKPGWFGDAGVSGLRSYVFGLFLAFWTRSRPYQKTFNYKVVILAKSLFFSQKQFFGKKSFF